MNNGHVGRPTNEEVKIRNRKKFLKIIVPIILIAGLVLFLNSQSSFKSIMGNSTADSECSVIMCDAGWKLDKEKEVCYQETKKDIDAYILGDANGDGSVDVRDFQLMKHDILNGVDLDERKNIIYDIDQSGEVDTNKENNGEYNEDLNTFLGYIDTANTSSLLNTKKPVCPKNIDESDKKIVYDLNETEFTCTETTTLFTEGKCVYLRDKESKLTTGSSKSSSNNSNKIVISYNSNGGSGKKMEDTTVKSGAKLRKNKYSRSGNTFIGWRIKRKSDDKWLCYTNSKKSDKSYSNKSTCNKYGYVVWSDQHDVSHVKTNVTVYARWLYNYNSGIKSFNGFELSPSKTINDKKATVWPVIKLTVYKKSNGTKSTGKTVGQGQALYVQDMTNAKSLKNSYVKIKTDKVSGWINGEYVMINLPDVIPSISYKITNAKKSLFKYHNESLIDNSNKKITGNDLYAGSWYGYNKRISRKEFLAPVRLQTAKMIQRAQSTALAHRNSLKIYDAFRPYSAQQRIVQGLKKKKFSGKQYCVSSKFSKDHNSNGSSVRCLNETHGWFIATKASSHNFGKAIDVALINDDDKQRLDTQSSMHELSGWSVPTESDVNSHPVELSMNKLFTGSGFDYLISEWWHFEDDNRKSVNGVDKLGSNSNPLKLKYWNN